MSRSADRPDAPDNPAAKRPVMLALMSVAACGFSLASSLAAAQTREDVGPRSEDREELLRVEKELARRQQDEARLKDEAAARAREVETLRDNMIETAEALQQAERRIERITSEIEALEAESATISSKLNAEAGVLSDILGGLQSLERAKPPALLAAPGDAVDAARAAMLLADAAPALKAKADELRAALARLATVQSQLEDERAAERKTNDEIGARRRLLAELLNSKQQERSVAEKLAQAAQSETAALAARATSLRGVLSALERLAREIAPRLKPDPRSKQPPTNREDVSGFRAPSLRFRPSKAFDDARGALAPPVVGDIIGSFGKPRPEGGTFEGVRFNAAPNALVTAPHDASVKFAQFYPVTGNLIVLDVGDGYHILLMGIGSFLIDEGQTVAAGEPIGVMGPDVTLLDMEIRRARDPVNPVLWLADKTGG